MNTLSSSGTVLILGANGRFGRAATKAFVQSGWQVIAQSRSALKLDANIPDGLVGNITPLTCDALDTATVVAAIPKVDVIVHALNPDYARWDVLLPPVTDAVIKIAQATGGYVMVPGNVYNFGKDLPEILSEETPFVANTPKAAQRIAMEQAIRYAPNVRSVVIRAGDFIGGGGGWLELAILKELGKGRVTHLGDPTLAHTWAYLPDLAQVFVRVAEQRQALPARECLHFEGYGVSTSELHKALESITGRKLKTKAMAWRMLKIVALFSPMIKALIQMRYLWQRPHRLVSHKLPALFGEVPATPLSTALEQVLNEIGRIAP